jgi:hypothetical protein
MQVTRCIYLTLMLSFSAVSNSAPPERADILAAMKKATAFMTGTVALNGGYVWLVSDDLKRRWGEIPARP